MKKKSQNENAKLIEIFVYDGLSICLIDATATVWLVIFACSLPFPYTNLLLYYCLQLTGRYSRNLFLP